MRGGRYIVCGVSTTHGKRLSATLSDDCQSMGNILYGMGVSGCRRSTPIPLNLHQDTDQVDLCHNCGRCYGISVSLTFAERIGAF